MITLTSYGVRHGAPPDGLTLALDCRAIRNPHRNRDLRYLSGLDPRVAREVMRHPEALDLIDRIVTLARNGDSIGLYCFGGRHRSVAVAEAAALRLRTIGRTVTVIHRDIHAAKPS